MKHAANKVWLASQLAKLGTSQAVLATFVGLDKASLNRTLTGDRKLQIHEAIAMSDVFGVSLNEVLLNFDYRVRVEEKKDTADLEANNKKLKIVIDALVAQIGGGK